MEVKEFIGGEIVKLRVDFPEAELKSGDVGVLWGVYNTDPLSYEATFRNQRLQLVDMTFEFHQVEQLPPQAKSTLGDELNKFLLSINKNNQ